jgi:hypothetical protein
VHIDTFGTLSTEIFWKNDFFTELFGNSAVECFQNGLFINFVHFLECCCKNEKEKGC